MSAYSYHLDVDIYRYKSVLIIGKDPTECNSHLAELWAENNPDDPHMEFIGKQNFNGRFTQTSSSHPNAVNINVIMICVGKPDKYDQDEWETEIQITIAHEAIHMAFDILNHVGIDIDHDNHEALTYLVSYIQKQINTFIKDVEP